MSRRYTKAPEPYRDPPLYREPAGRRPQNPHLRENQQFGDQSTEFGYGPGPVAPHLNGEPPAAGGIYMPKAPRVDPPPSGIGRPLPHRRPRNEARGDSGDRIR